MKRLCDYDAIVHYRPGAFSSKYKTDLSGKLQEIERICYNEQIVNSFRDGDYKTFRTIEPVVLYRVFGRFGSDESSTPKGAQLGGAFASTEFAESIIDAKIRLALAPEWFNTKMYEARLVVPAGEIISVGIVERVVLKTGTVLSGGADQILLPYKWPKEWITGYRRITSRQLLSPPYYARKGPEQFDTKSTVYTKICPSCGCEEVRQLPDDEQIPIVGIKGNQYTLKYTCLNSECKYFW